MAKANPTIKTQQEILNVIQNSEAPMSVSAIADSSGKGLYATKQAVEFFEKLGVIRTITSSGNTTIVILNLNNERGVNDVYTTKS